MMQLVFCVDLSALYIIFDGWIQVFDNSCRLVVARPSAKQQLAQSNCRVTVSYISCLRICWGPMISKYDSAAVDEVLLIYSFVQVVEGLAVVKLPSRIFEFHPKYKRFMSIIMPYNVSRTSRSITVCWFYDVVFSLSRCYETLRRLKCRPRRAERDISIRLNFECTFGRIGSSPVCIFRC